MSEAKPSVHALREEKVLGYWEANKIFEKSVEGRPKDRQYTFYDGPPFATGLPHYGHLVASTMKDVVPRFWTMRGYRVERTWGWDCHGLPIENIVEKEFDLKSRKDIDEYGVGAFNNRCETKVLEYADEWKKVIKRLGRWVDMENAYKTMDLPFMESIWWVFKELWDKGMIYEGYKPMHLCPRCETTLSNFEVALNYADVTDISVTAMAELTTGEYRGAKLLVWTTTPWTLPGNVLIAVGADIPYALVECEGQKYIVAEALAPKVFAGKEYTVATTFTGSVLEDASYDPIFPHFRTHENAFRVVHGDFVTTEDGTGLVHIAPAYGADDKALGDAEGVSPLFHVQRDGHFVPELVTALVAEGYAVENVPVKAKGVYSDADVQIIKWLAHQGKLFAKEKYTHSYPLCWRCDTPLLNYAASSWFVKVTPMVDDLLKNNNQINWVPDNMKVGRFGKWLEGARDWAISRSRFWGTPLPVWKSDDGEVLVIGSVEELEKLVGHKVDNLHKHVVDLLTFEKDGKTYKRIEDVLDCWFESGSMPYAQRHYPFENKDDFANRFPAQFIAEGQDQTRGWFYTLHVLSTALFDKPAFENVIVNGLVLAEDGKKMSKKLQNYPDPMEVVRKYGADAVRYYMMASPVVEAENLRFAESGVDEVTKKLVTILENVTSFYELYKAHDDGRTPALNHVMDAWIVARLKEATEKMTGYMEAYELSPAARELQGFVTDLSTWYVRRSRERVKSEGEDRAEALATLRVALDTLAKLMAPFTPFIAEEVYQRVAGGYADEKRLSVHLEMWPEAASLPVSAHVDVIDRMGEARALVSRINDAREGAGVAIKQALGTVKLSVPTGELADGYVAEILGETNIKKAMVEKGQIAVDVDFTLTPELLRDGLARELIRRVNQLRKDVGLTINDRVELHVSSADGEVMKMLEEHGRDVQEATLATALSFGRPPSVTHEADFRAQEKDIWIGLVR